MAITIQSELVAAVQNWRARTDLSSTRCAEFIALAEAKINRDIRDLAQETKSTSFSITGEYVNVPSSFLAVKLFQTTYGGVRYALRQASHEQETNMYNDTGPPKFFTVTGSQFRFSPIPDATYTATLIYFVTLTALGTTGSNTNWLLTSHPDVYLYASLFEAAVYEQDAEAAAAYKALYREEVESLKKAAKGNRWSGTGLAITMG